MPTKTIEKKKTKPMDKRLKEALGDLRGVGKCDYCDNPHKYAFRGKSKSRLICMYCVEKFYKYMARIYVQNEDAHKKAAVEDMLNPNVDK